MLTRRKFTLPPVSLTMVAAALAIAGGTGCSATAIVRPLPRGMSAWTASLGGPVAPSAVPTVVIPYLTVGWQQGMTDDLTVGGSLHATMAAFGVAGVDVSATRRLLSQDGARPELVATARGSLFTDGSGGGTRLYPSLGLVGSWAAGPRTLWYAGADAMAQTRGAPAVLAVPLLGVQRRIGTQTAVQVEAKWMAANVDSPRGVLEGEGSIGGRGAFALQFGFVRYRGGPR